MGRFFPILDTCYFEASVDLLILIGGKLIAKKEVIFQIAGSFGNPVHWGSLKGYLNGESLDFEFLLLPFSKGEVIENEFF